MNTPTNPQDGVPYPLYEPFLQSQGTYPTPAAARDVAWFERARLGMFIHWNHCTVAPAEISWVMKKGSQTLSEYQELAKTLPIWEVQERGLSMAAYEGMAQLFNPVEFSADEWVSLARAAGMNYMLLVVKHHDGFAMWDTKTSDYKITNTPFKRDVCREIADACHKAGMRLGWYYSPTDWWHPASRAGDWDAYAAYMQEHLRELMTEYGTVDFLAFDFWSPVCKHPSWPTFYQELRRLCPHHIQNRSTPWSIGDYECIEHVVPYFRNKKGSTANSGIVTGEYRSRMTCDAPFEVMDCIQGGRWSYEFGKAVPLKSIINNLVDAATSGGNLTLNVTPDSLGRIPPAQVERLQEIGAWMRTHGETIVGTNHGPCPPLLVEKTETAGPRTMAPEMFGGSPLRQKGSRCAVGCTNVGSRIYIHVLDWLGSTSLVVPNVADRVLSCRLLGSGPVITRREGNALRIMISEPERAILDTVIVLELDGPAIDIDGLQTLGLG